MQQNADDWSPSLQMQSWMDMEKLEKEAELQARRQKRARESGEDLTASFSGRRSFRARKQVSYGEVYVICCDRMFSVSHLEQSATMRKKEGGN